MSNREPMVGNILLRDNYVWLITGIHKRDGGIRMRARDVKIKNHSCCLTYDPDDHGIYTIAPRYKRLSGIYYIKDKSNAK